jgi:small GTP-binding protein
MIQRKVCLIGDFAVGKTSLFQRFVYNRFSESYLTTVGVLVQRKALQVRGQDVNLILWDTEGGKDSDTVKESYVAGAAGAVIVCDLTRVGSILHCQGYAEVLRRINPNMQLMLAGNKRDLIETDSHAHLSVVRQVARKEKLPMTLTSALSGAGIEAMFMALATALLPK